ncbi:uncharacterized protein BXZ73DRAFT_101986 [Epithele typhae]|uniref:uncharacterized protein n=1 Tax=Epithele typhae TaxID=378194 RepID=UPI002008DCDE|nr:uncharacterized protein BXZ73DRAFT_101986 [Epithele typhae]KAH9929923.1 hypothetical protein BXZ73DRAFT_101986 [Epithele typhae]
MSSNASLANVSQPQRSLSLILPVGVKISANVAEGVASCPEHGVSSTLENKAFPHIVGTIKVASSERYSTFCSTALSVAHADRSQGNLRSTLNRDVSLYYFEAVLRVGLCVELSSSSAITPILAHAQLQTFSLGLDQSVTPRDQPCWCRVEAVSYIVSFIFVGVIYFLPAKHLHASQYDVLELFHDVHRQHSSPRSAGPSTSSSNAAEDIFKTACYTFYLPVALVMRLRGIPQLASLELALKTLAACPELVAGYWPSAGLALEPRLPSKWLANIPLFGVVASLPVPTASLFLAESGSSGASLNFHILLKAYIITPTPAVRAAIVALIRYIFAPGVLFRHDPDEIALWLEYLPRTRRAPGPQSRDGTPYKYVEDLRQAAGAGSIGPCLDAVPSPLLATVVEQLGAKFGVQRLAPADAPVPFSFARKLIRAYANRMSVLVEGSSW